VAQGRVVLLNGTAACGKTSLARALQKILLHEHDEAWITLCIDEFWSMSMVAFFGKANGIWHDDLGGGHRALRFDDRARPLGDAIVYSTVACARAGIDVIADSVLWDETAAQRWEEELQGLQCLRIGLVGSLDVFLGRGAQREREGGLPAEVSQGITRHYFESVHQYTSYDLTIDTSVTDAETAARQVAALIIETAGRSTL
jgi:chloramphenicol 3-O-phosphotransferase